MKKYILASFLSVSIFSGQAAIAQVNPSIEPGRINENFQQKERPKLFKTPLIKVDKSTNETSGSESDIKFLLNKVVFEGSSVFSGDELGAIVESFAGNKISLAEVNQIAKEVTVKYRNAGYISSKAIVPPQKIKKGTVKIQIIEGGVDQVIIEGEVSGDREIIERFSNKIKSVGAMSSEKLERYLLLIDDLPGVDARAVLKPSPNRVGYSDVYLILSEKRVEYAVSLDNFSSRYLGSYKLDTQAVINSPFGKFGRTAIRAIITPEIEEMKYVSLSHEAQIADEGTKVVYSISYTDTEPGQKLDNLGLEGESITGSIRFQHPMIRSRQENLYGTFGFTAKGSKSEAFGVKQYRDDIRTAEFGFSYDVFDGYYGTNQADILFTKGLGIAGASEASDPRSRSNAIGSFEKLNFTYTRIQAVPEVPISVYLSATGQYARNPLLSSEEFGVGGRSYGRAYDPSEISGDRGVATVFEIRYLTQEGPAFIQSYQPFVFYDFGKVWNKEVFAGEVKSVSVASVGIGSRFNLDYDFTGEAMVAVPLTKEVTSYGTEGDDPKILFSLTKRF